MPLMSNPAARAEFSLESDAEIPDKDRPVFLVRFLKPEGVEQHKTLMEQAFASPDPRETWRKLWEAVSIGITGWRNFRGSDGSELEFNEANFFAVLTDRERWLVGWRYPGVVRFTPAKAST